MTLRSVVTELGAEAAEALQAKVCLYVTDAFFSAATRFIDNSKKQVKAMLQDTKELYDELLTHVRKKVPDATLPNPKHPWIDYSAVAGDAGDEDKKKQQIKPVVLKFDEDGAPITKQIDYREETDTATIACVPVASWQASAAANAMDIESYHNATIHCIMAQHHHSDKVVDQPLQLL